jgi:hypothetical protein
LIFARQTGDGGGTVITRTTAVRQLLEQAAARVGGADWTITGGNRLRATLDSDTQAIILPLAAGSAAYTVSVCIGPRFPAAERIVAKASRVAGQPATATIFPTLFERLSSISSVPDHAPLSEIEQIIEALHAHAVAFVRNRSTAGAAADYALANPLPYGHHAKRIPVLLAKAGRRSEAEDYLDRQINGGMPYPDFMTRYREALMPLL